MTVLKALFLHGLDTQLVQMVLAELPAGLHVQVLHTSATDEQKSQALSDADFLILYRAKVSDHAFAAAKKLRLVQLLAAGYDGINIALLRQLGVPCANNGGANSWAVADHSVLLMLALYRRLLSTDRELRNGNWNAGISGLNTFELADKLVGIVGLGHIGKKVARRVLGFDARVQYFNRVRLDAALERELGVRYASLDEIFESSDILTLHAPLTPETRRLVNENRLRSMKASAMIINTGRGEMIDQAALANALASRRLLGAGLDAFDPEPVHPDDPLLQLDNVILSPHSAGTTADTWRRRGSFAGRNLALVASGMAPESVVNGVPAP